MRSRSSRRSANRPVVAAPATTRCSERPRFACDLVAVVVVVMLAAFVVVATSLLPQGSPQLSRRAVLSGALSAAAVSPALQASAFFESSEQKALTRMSTAQTKLADVVSEVANTKRKRVKMATDPDDDAFVFRFARAVLDPVRTDLAEAAPAISQERSEQLLGEFKQQLAALDAAVRKKDAAAELDALEGAQRTIVEALKSSQGGKKKYDLKSVDDINAYEGATSVLYPGLLFQPGVGTK